MIITPNIVLGGLQVLDTLLGGSRATPQSQPQPAGSASAQQTFRQVMQAARQATPSKGLEIRLGDASVRSAGDRDLRLRF